MLAIIIEDNTKYVTPIFAIKQIGWGSEVLAFNKEHTHLKRIKMWHSFRKVFIVKWEQFNYKKSSWEGYDWVLQDKKLWKALRFGKEANIEDFPQFKDYSKEIILPDWFEINDELDIQSLMNVSMSFHDSILIGIDRSENDIEIEFDTSWGCILKVKFKGIHSSKLIESIGMIYDSTIEKSEKGYIWEITCFDPGEVGGIIKNLPILEYPYIECDKIEWNIKIGKSEYFTEFKKYNSFYDFYLDLKNVSKDVFFKDDKLILHHKKDILTIEEDFDGYIVYLNGIKEHGKFEEQDIYEYAVEFLTQVNVEDIKEEILVDVVSSKPFYVLHYIKYALIFAISFFIIGLFTLFASNFKIGGIFLAILFFIISAIIILFSLWSLIKNEGKRYIVTSTTIYYFTNNISNQSLNISQIKDIKLCRSFLKKKIGTIKIKQKNCIGFGYGLIAINDAEEIYNIIEGIIKKNDDNK